VGPWATVDTLQTGCSYIQASSQDKECNHVYHGYRPRLPVREGSGAPRILHLRILPLCKRGLQCATYPTSPDPASLWGGGGFGAPRVIQLRILPHCRGGRQSAMCPMAPDLASLLRGLWCRYRMSCGPLWASGLKHKEKPSRPACAARPACSQCTHACFQDA
jgi:hypothetical protein